MLHKNAPQRRRPAGELPARFGAGFGQAQVADGGLLAANWRMGDSTTLHLLANLSTAAIAKGRGGATGRAIWGGEPGDLVPPWSVFWRVEAR